MYLMPYVLVDDYLISKYSRYLVFGLLALALSLSWGYGGILNLGQALPFGLGSYCMAMALKLRTIPVQTGAGGLPDFMVWNNVQHAALVLGAILLDDLRHRRRRRCALGADGGFGWFMFRGRVTGVFVAITTLAMLVVVNLLIIDQQQYTGGFNGITDLAQLTIGGIVFDAYNRTTFYLIASSPVVILVFGYVLSRSKIRPHPAGDP